MAKSKADFPIDTWLMVATDALARYAAGGGTLQVWQYDDTLTISVVGLTLEDPRVAQAFADAFRVVAIADEPEAAQ